MATVVKSFTIDGIDAIPVDIEATTLDIGGNVSSVSIIGLGDQAVREAGDRLTAALIHSGYFMPSDKVILNLGPGDLKKRGSHYDLGMAVALLSETGQIYSNFNLREFIFIGELSLNGVLRPVNGMISMAAAAAEGHYRYIVVPSENAKEAAIIENIKVIGVRTLRQLTDLLEDEEMFASSFYTGENGPDSGKTDTADDIFNNKYEDDFADVIGQDKAVSGAMYAAAGGHNILMIGEPGCGKSMIAKRIAGILPPMTDAESMETTRIHSIAGTYHVTHALMRERPFRAPHNNISMNALIGGGHDAMPGEITLAHNGVLFLDELFEFSKHTLEALRQPLEDKIVTVSRVNRTNIFPANFMLVAATNPCPCGYYPGSRCRCTPKEVFNYRKQMSGPIMERIDINVNMHPIGLSIAPGRKENKSAKTRSSAELRERVVNARRMQAERFKGIPGVTCNAQMTDAMLDDFCPLDSEGARRLERAALMNSYSPRMVKRTLRLARTIADVREHENILAEDVKEACSLKVNL